MKDMFTLIAVFGMLNGLLGIMVLQKIYRDGVGLIDRISTALLICGSVALAGSTLSDYYLWRSFEHYPEGLITVAIFVRLCLRLRREDEEYPVRTFRPRYPIEH